MSNVDLSKLSIADLEEVTEGYWQSGEEMIVSDNRLLYSCDVIAVNQKIKGDYKAVTTTGNFKKAYKIPKPQKRERTVVEKVKFLQKIERELKDDELLVNRYPKDRWSIHTRIRMCYFNEYEYAIYKSEDNIEIIEIPQIEVVDE